MKNTYKTSDIKINKDSQDCYTAEHTYQGLLIDSAYYRSRGECRRDAVEVLKEKQELDL